MSGYDMRALARYLGVSQRTVRSWGQHGLLPQPAYVENGRKLWSPQQAQEILRWQRNRKKLQ